ncbi:MAG: M3 family metallopeptidase [Xanthomonadales bacterium]|nr:M3 family metallopeptidase [Xanthomonadales bacterium]
MTLNRLLLSCILLTQIACDSAEDSTIAGTDASSTDAAALPVRYSEVRIADLYSAEQLSNACEAEAAALRKHLAAMESFEGTPTVEGYLESLNSLSVSLANIQLPAQSLSGVHPDPAVRSAAETCTQSLSSIGTDIGLSRPIFEAVNRLDTSAMDEDTRFAVEKLLLGFRLSGVDKDEATRERIRALNAELVTIGQEWDRNIREDVRFLELDSVEDLAGLPQDYIDAHPPGEDGKIRISTQYPDLFPFMNYSERDDLRRSLSVIYQNRGYPANEPVLRQLVEKRHELAQLIGFENWAELITADKMVGSPERVAQFLAELTEYTAQAQDREYDVLLARLRQEQPDAERLHSWQFGYINEKVQQEQYQVDSREVRQYFAYDRTRDGMLRLVQDLFDVSIEPWETETWNDDVTAYELKDGERVLGRFYLDMHPRDGKFQHAAMFPFVLGIKDQQVPVAALVCNFPSGDGLMQHSQVVTFLHEFGHLIHWLFAGHQPWGNTSGIQTEWDFVEAPSQMLEEWVWDYETLAAFAQNADGETLPRDLLDRMIAARDFGLGMGTRRQLSLAAISLNLYRRAPHEVDFDALVDEMARTYTKFEPIEDTHFWAAFGHLNGYSAIYYTYQWSKAIATDMFTRFEEAGLRNVEVAGEYRDKVLAPGGSRPANELVTDFLGREISFKPYADRLSGAVRDAEAGTD